MLAGVTPNADGGVPRTGRLPTRRWRVLALVALVCAAVLVFEYVLYTTALVLFTHLDSPECAGSNTFCYPDGTRGVTGGAVVVAVGNLGAVAILVAVFVLLRVRRRAAHARS
jgi:hypothetical protein